MKNLIISADDFAQSPAIDQGILELIRMGRLTATSCLVMSPRWQEAASQLSGDIRSKADIGLHLDFTQYGAGLKYGLGPLILRSFADNLPSRKVTDAIHTQLDRFEDELGTAPDYIDGHQHVHQLPQIRQALTSAIQQRYPYKTPWVRLAQPPAGTGFKAMIIRNLGATALARHCKRKKIATSAHLLGVYDFKTDEKNYWKLLDQWLAAAADNDALMCHPATPSLATDIDDVIYPARCIEYAVFAEERFVELLKQHEIRLVRHPVL